MALTRKSPSIHASNVENKVGLIKKGNDKKDWIILKTNKGTKKRWFPLGTNKIYYTMDNGADKYKVVISDKNVYIFTALENTLVKEIKKYKNIFIGKNSKKYGPYNEPFIGSSVLIELKPKKYVIISNNIIYFETIEPITEFYSIMGNSSVTYPFAFSKNYVYILQDANLKYMKRDFGDIDPYEVFYDFKKQYKKPSFDITRITQPK